MREWVSYAIAESAELTLEQATTTKALMERASYRVDDSADSA